MFDLATAKTRLNITGTTQDVLLQTGLDTAIAIAENYCKRQFKYAAEVAHYYYTDAGVLFVSRYPIEQVQSVVSAKNTKTLTDYKVNKSAGMIMFKGYAVGEQIDITYAGGYKTLPADLELALWLIFDGVWKSLNSSGGSVSSGGIASISVPDVGTIRYDTGSSSSGNTNAGLIPATGIAILDNYIAQRA